MSYDPYNPYPSGPIQVERPSWFKRNGGSAFTVSLFIHGIILLLAIFVFIKWIYPPAPPPPDFSGNSGGGGGNEGQIANKVKTQMHRSMSSTAVKRVAISGESSFVLPDNADDPISPDLPNVASLANSSGTGGGGGGGHGGGMGTGTGTGEGPGHGTGKGFISIPAFGSKMKIPNALEGHLYDFKQNEKGQPVPYVVDDIPTFATRVQELQKRGFRDLAFKNYFKAPDTLYLNKLVIKPQPADNGPSFFGAADKVKPSGWLAHYTGDIKAPRDIQFRFVGSADDYISVYIRGRPRLIATRPEIQTIMQEKWNPTQSGTGPMGTLIYGDWIRMTKGEVLPMDLSISERPGGIVGFLLMIQEKDVAYQKAGDGREIIPIWTTQEITPEVREQTDADFPGWGFDWEHVVVFGGEAKSFADPFK